MTRLLHRTITRSNLLNIAQKSHYTTQYARALTTSPKMSDPAPYLLHVTSRPTQVSPQTWKKWYISEHLPDFVASHTAVRATFYEEIELPGSPPSGSDRKFLAMYQSVLEDPLETENYRGVRTTSGLFERDGAGSDAFGDNGDFDARYYGLVQVYDPRGLGEGMACFVLQFQYRLAPPGVIQSVRIIG
jgi:hypothetical protein